MGGGNQNLGGAAVRANPVEDALKWMLAPQVTPEQTDAWFNPPTPSALPEPPPEQIPIGPGMHNFRPSVMASEIGGEIKDMLNAPVELTKRAMDPQLSVPSRLAAAAGAIGAAAQLDPLLPHGGRAGKVKEPPPQQSGTVRIYHGGSTAAGQAGTDFTTHQQYARDYAAKSEGTGGEGMVWYVDVPEGVVKTHDEYGLPMTRVVVPPEIAAQAKPLGEPPQPGAGEVIIPPRFRVVGSRGRGTHKPTSDYDIVTELSPKEYEHWITTPEGEYPRLPKDVTDAAHAGHDTFIQVGNKAYKVEPHPVDAGQVVVERVSQNEQAILSGAEKPPPPGAKVEFDAEHLIHGTNLKAGEQHFDYVEPRIGDFTREMYAGAGEGTFEEMGGKPLAYFKPTSDVKKITNYAEGVSVYPKTGEPYLLVTEKPSDAMFVKEDGVYDFEGNLISHDVPLGAETGDIISEEGARVLHRIPLKDFQKSGAKSVYDYLHKPPPQGAGIEQAGGQGVKAVMKLTGEDAQEVSHKMNVMRDTPEIYEDYGMSSEQMDQLIESIPGNGGNWEVPHWAKDAVHGELTDHIEVLRDIAADARSANDRGSALRINKQATRFERMLDNLLGGGTTE